MWSNVSPFVGYVVCKHILPLYTLSFHPLNRIFQSASLKFGEVQCIRFSFLGCAFDGKLVFLTTVLHCFLEPGEERSCSGKEGLGLSVRL